jgi:GAF domain-containing protein
VTLSRKEAKSRTGVPSIRSDRTKRTHVGPAREPRAELEKKLEARTRELIEARTQLAEARERLVEAVEQQTAASEVLGVISSSPGALKPVFQAMLESAVRICEANFGNLFLSEGNAFRIVALQSAPPAWAERWQRDPVVSIPDKSEIPLARLARTKQVVHISDLRAEQSYIEHDYPIVALIELAGARTYLAVPMLKENELVGAIAIYRQEARPFTDKQIELVQNFAAQAVIAIENTRLLNELRESLQQQTATSDVLQVISSSPGQLEPVFQAMLENATRICEAKFGVLLQSEEDAFRVVAMHNPPPSFADLRRRIPVVRPNPGTALGRAAAEKQTVQIVDVQAAPAYRDAPADFSSVHTMTLGGARTVVAVPMLKEHELVGAIAIYRQEVRPFTDKQIELVTNFAQQAVIAIENTRLLNELRQRTDDLSESLQQQAASMSRMVLAFRMLIS